MHPYLLPYLFEVVTSPALLPENRFSAVLLFDRSSVSFAKPPPVWKPECTEYPALTIHKSIGLTGEAGEEEWKNEQPIPDDLIIADEFSMVDMYLADKLFASIKYGQHLQLFPSAYGV